MISKVLRPAISCNNALRPPMNGNCNVINNFAFLQLFFFLLPEVQLVRLCSGGFPISGESIRQLDLVFRDPLHEQALEFAFQFTKFCRISTRHSCASSDEWFLVWLRLHLRIHSNSDAKDIVLLLDILHVLVKVLQHLVVLFQVLLPAPRVWKVHREGENTSQNDQDHLLLVQESLRRPMFCLLTAITALPCFCSFSKVHPNSSAVPSGCQFGVP